MKLKLFIFNILTVLVLAVSTSQIKAEEPKEIGKITKYSTAMTPIFKYFYFRAKPWPYSNCLQFRWGYDFDRYKRMERDRKIFERYQNEKLLEDAITTLKKCSQKNSKCHAFEIELALTIAESFDQTYKIATAFRKIQNWFYDN